MTEELEQLLKNLKLRRMLSVYDEQLHAAEKAAVSYSEFVAGLLRAQWHDRQESALEWRIGRANLPERWSLETFPYARQPGVHRKQIRAFAELDFVAKHENLVLVGQTGVGKTGLACGLLLKALQNGHRCQFVRAQDLFDEMYVSLADRSTRGLLNRLARLDVLSIDEFGYLNLKPEQSNTFFKLMEERYHRHSTIITTNLVYDEWHNFLGNKPMVDALLSRVRHYHRNHRRPVAAGPARLRRIPWKRSPSAGKNISKGFSAPTAKRREPQERSANRTDSWLPSFRSAACPWLRSKTHWFWPRRAGSFVRPDLRRSARFDPWLTSRQSSKKCWSCASAQSTSSICATGSNASPKRVADSPSETKPPHPPRLRRG
jgi:DNA replication protein DnaC